MWVTLTMPEGHARLVKLTPAEARLLENSPLPCSAGDPNSNLYISEKEYRHDHWFYRIEVGE